MFFFHPGQSNGTNEKSPGASETQGCVSSDSPLASLTNGSQQESVTNGSVLDNVDKVPANSVDRDVKSSRLSETSPSETSPSETSPSETSVVKALHRNDELESTPDDAMSLETSAVGKKSDVVDKVTLNGVARKVNGTFQQESDNQFEMDEPQVEKKTYILRSDLPFILFLPLLSGLVPVSSSCRTR